MVQRKPDASEKLAQTLTGAVQIDAAVKPKPQKPVKTVPIKQGNAQEQPQALTADEQAVVTGLVLAGLSYAQAVARLKGGGDNLQPTPGPAISDEERKRILKLAEGDDSDLPPVEDVEDKSEVLTVDFSMRQGFKCLLDDLWTRREEMKSITKKTQFAVTFQISQPELDWLLHRTITEGQSRGDANFTPNLAMIMLLKQQKALDPTRGGQRSMGSSGPKESFNPSNGDWTKKA
jgi:hypothetical protein